MAYMITYTQSSPNFDEFHISEEIVKQWPEASMWYDFNDDCLWWQPTSIYFSCQYKSGTIFTEEGSLDMVIDVALWYRSIVPAEILLILFHQTGIARGRFIKLDQSTTREILLDEKNSWI